jgi:hypothetical protein
MLIPGAIVDLLSPAQRFASPANTHPELLLRYAQALTTEPINIDALDKVGHTAASMALNLASRKSYDAELARQLANLASKALQASTGSTETVKYLRQELEEAK